MKSTLIRWTARSLHRMGLVRPFTLAADYARPGRAFQVLTYHRVNDDHDPFFEALPTDVFEAQMAHVARTHCVLTVEEMVERAEADRLPKNALAITFDDGYRDNLTHAAPILARYGLPATIFLATGFIGGGDAPWFDRLALAFTETTRSDLQAPWGETFALASREDRVRALHRSFDRLKSVPDDESSRMLEELLAELRISDPYRLKDVMLTWDDVQALVGLGFSIGAHTVSHPILSRVSTDRARMEIVLSRTTIEAMCGRPVTAFAYPNGGVDDYTPEIVELVREAGFSCAVTTRFGLNTPATSPWELRRGGPWEREAAVFGFKLALHRIVAERS